MEHQIIGTKDLLEPSFRLFNGYMFNLGKYTGFVYNRSNYGDIYNQIMLASKYVIECYNIIDSCAYHAEVPNQEFQDLNKLVYRKAVEVKEKLEAILNKLTIETSRS